MNVGRIVRTCFAHPLARDADIDHPSAVELRRQIIRSNGFLRRIYDEWYGQVVAALPFIGGAVLELGSDSGFLGEYVPDVITSDVFHHSGVDVVLDGLALPIADNALRGIVLIDVLHHLSNVRSFFKEATRTIRPGGAIAMLEPWVTSWSSLMYRNLHHEPFCPDAERWEFDSTGPLSGANQALPWILFERDRARFAEEFPQWSVKTIKVQMPFRYLLSGGVSMRRLMPVATFESWRKIETALQPLMSKLGMFAFIVLSRRNS